MIKTIGLKIIKSFLTVLVILVFKERLILGAQAERPIYIIFGNLSLKSY